MSKPLWLQSSSIAPMLLSFAFPCLFNICTLEHQMAEWKEKRFDFFCAVRKTTPQHIVPGMYLLYMHSLVEWSSQG